MKKTTQRKNRQMPKTKVMPEHFPDDPPSVTLLLKESLRMTQMGADFDNKPANPIAAQQCYMHGWAMNLAAAWLRCKSKGELEPEKSNIEKLKTALRGVTYYSSNIQPKLDTPQNRELADKLANAIREAEKFL